MEDTALHFGRMLIPVRTGPAARTDLTRRIEAIPPETMILAAVIVVGAAIRLATLGTQSYWTDEATTVHDIRQSFGGLLHQVHRTRRRRRSTSSSPGCGRSCSAPARWGLRSLSAMLGIGAIPIVYLCGRELVSRAAGLVAAALAAVSPFMVWYSQEARSYMLFAVLSGLSFLFCARAWKRRTDRDVVWWAVFSALAVLTHFFAAFLVAPEALMLLYRLRSRVSMLAAGAVLVAQLAVLPLAVSDTSHPLGWIKGFPLSTRIQQVPVDFGLGALYQSSLVTGGLLGAAILAAIVLALLLLGGGRAERRGAAFAAALAAIVVLVPLAARGARSRLLRGAKSDPGVDSARRRARRGLHRPSGPDRRRRVCRCPSGRLSVGRDPHRQPPAVSAARLAGRGQALGKPPATRAIVAYDGGFAAQPLAVYMRGVPWLRSPPSR